MSRKYNEDKAVAVSLKPIESITADDIRYLQAVAMASVQVRRIQRQYFRNRSTADLNTAREMERELDSLMQGPSDTGSTPDLFREPNES